MSTTKITELKLMFLTGPLDDVCDIGAPVLPKWQMKEAMHNMIEAYLEQLIDEGEFTTVMAAGRRHKTPNLMLENDSDKESDKENE